MTAMKGDIPVEFRVETLSLKQVRKLYTQRLTEDFPRDELKPLFAIEVALVEGRYVCYGAMRGDEILAYAFFVKLGQTALVDYYAVMREERDEGIGSRFLQALIEGELKNMDCVLLEVEDPDRADDPAEREIRQRRLSFYLRNGLLNTGVRTNVFGVEYLILALPVGPDAGPEEIRQAYAALYRAMLPRRLYDAEVKL